MDSQIDISVVMSVHNAAPYLRQSIDSIVSQRDVNLEFVVVDDGSTDSSPNIIAEYAANDSRIRVLRHNNIGLTRSLIRGCASARGRYIARQDADDVSLPLRLKLQRDLLDSYSDVSCVSCWSWWIGPMNEFLYEVTRPITSQHVTDGLLNRGEGPPGHGSVMFRAEEYRKVGGYRSEFRFAQDWDLWLRLVELGQMACVPAFGYAYRVSANAISSSMKRQQDSLREIARLCYDARRRGDQELRLLREALRVSDQRKPSWLGRAPGNNYFVGKALLKRGDPRAQRYFGRVLRQNPLHVYSWLFFLASQLRRNDPRPPLTLQGTQLVPDAKGGG
jgi:glycosyltransferase involved in cell wall biosynthesis